MTFEELRLALKPKGTEPVVRLGFNNPFFKHDFVEQCIHQLMIKNLTQDVLTPLERIGAIALFDTAGVEDYGTIFHNSNKSNS